ncbi:MAG: hypothetical protein JXA60_10250 [Candidatus Coatesbacteria bacterium]|nr:hypothetical protein [Candidatus Coatesbacteria bacterium]
MYKSIFAEYRDGKILINEEIEFAEGDKLILIVLANEKDTVKINPVREIEIRESYPPERKI